MLFLRHCVQPGGNGEVLADGFIPVFLGVRVHIKDQQSDELAGLDGDIRRSAWSRSGVPVLQFIKHPAGSGVLRHEQRVGKGAALGDAAGEIGNDYGIACTLKLWAQDSGINKFHDNSSFQARPA
nr:MAG TPA: hypothetical protein [Caudoviricetes sp.]